ncbi:MAG: DUF6176 family protein [Ancrocorticia sp.]
MIVELTRFRALPGTEAVIDEWMDFLASHPKEFKETLEPEKMYVESIFLEQRDGITYLYWYSVQGEDPKPVSESDHWFDKKHIEYWEKCIDETFVPEDLSVVLTAMPDRVERAMRPLGDTH